MLGRVTGAERVTELTVGKCSRLVLSIGTLQEGSWAGGGEKAVLEDKMPLGFQSIARPEWALGKAAKGALLPHDV